MNKITLHDAVKKMLQFKSTEQSTMLGIGPMSKTLIKATMLLAKAKDFPLMFIASRNQVDTDALGGGYVCGWNQERFAQAIAEVAEETGFQGLYYLCRDHGGPWQRDNERNAHLPEDEAMRLGKESYLADLLAGFDLLHIDPTKDPYVVGKVIDMGVNIHRTVELIAYVEGERTVRNLPPISYEVGTEETNGGLTSPENYAKFIERLHKELDTKGLPHPSFIVGNTGTLTRLTENVGHIDPKACKDLAAVARKFGVGLKEHNGDYLNEAVLLEHPALGVTAMNVAPEFGTVETRAYLELIKTEENLVMQGLIAKPSGLRQALEKGAVESGRWKKWMTNGKDKLTPAEIFKDTALTKLIVEISGHYTFNMPTVQEGIQTLYANLAQEGIEGEQYVIYKLQESLNRYVECFRMAGLTSRLQQK